MTRIGAAKATLDRRDDGLLDLGIDRRGLFGIGSQQMGVVQIGDEPGLDGRDPSGASIKREGNLRAGVEMPADARRCLVPADHGDKVAAGAERRDVARDIAGAADHLLGRRRIDDRRRRLRRNPRYGAIDEAVKHHVADHDKPPRRKMSITVSNGVIGAWSVCRHRRVGVSIRQLQSADHAAGVELKIAATPSGGPRRSPCPLLGCTGSGMVHRQTIGAMQGIGSCCW